MQASGFENEWLTLQNQFDSYEKYSLLIKLVSIVILSLTLLLDMMSIYMLLVFLILWLQDAIWKTFQSRMESRLLQVEKYLANMQSEENTGVEAYQFNSQYVKNRPGVAGLIKEYICQALRPTVAYPHAALLLLACAKWVF